ncbi:unnamed protein product [Blepharisma stoltei]|uniref:Uncharacterized protein n=1 Tax=Blepharisma stoltei TaxID=1481888 RepID=A0AAU9IIE4_9CILI|nr:unnamed protein product [Blepharisma stoltei]
MYTRSQSPVNVYQEPIIRRTIGQLVKGNKSENQDAAHIFSFEILNNIISKNNINKLKSTDDVIREMNKDINLVLKSRKENRIDDRRLDHKIKKAINIKKQVKKPEVISRIKKQYEIINQLNFPPELKNKLISIYEELKDENDRFICKREVCNNLKEGKIDIKEEGLKLHEKLVRNIRKRQIQRQEAFVDAAESSKSLTSKVKSAKIEEISEAEFLNSFETEIIEKGIIKTQKAETQASKKQLLRPNLINNEILSQQKKNQELIDNCFEENKISNKEKPCIKSPQNKIFSKTAPHKELQKDVEEKVSGKKFYKGGRFIPGGGRAPKGGIWI